MSSDLLPVDFNARLFSLDRSASIGRSIRVDDLHDPNPIFQVTEQDLQSVSEEARIDFLRERIFPQHHRPETQPDEKEHLRS